MIFQFSDTMISVFQFFQFQALEGKMTTELRNSEGLTFQEFVERFFETGIHARWTQEERGKGKRTSAQLEFLRDLADDILDGTDSKDDIRLYKDKIREAKTKGEASCLIDLWKFERDYERQSMRQYGRAEFRTAIDGHYDYHNLMPEEVISLENFDSLLKNGIFLYKNLSDVRGVFCIVTEYKPVSALKGLLYDLQKSFLDWGVQELPSATPAAVGAEHGPVPEGIAKISQEPLPPFMKAMLDENLDSFTKYYNIVKEVVHDLSVSDDEIQAIIDALLGLKLTKEEIRAVHARVFAAAIKQFIDDRSLDNIEMKKLHLLWKCLDTLGWAPGQVK